MVHRGDPSTEEEILQKKDAILIEPRSELGNPFRVTSLDVLFVFVTSTLFAWILDAL